MAIQIVDLRDPGRQQRNLQSIQAIGNLLQIIGKGEQLRQDRQRLDRVATAIQGGATTTEAILNVSKQEPSFDEGISGIFQRLSGALGGGGGQRDDLTSTIQSAIVKGALQKAFQPEALETPPGLEPSRVIQGAKGGITREFQRSQTGGKKTKAGELIKQIDKKLASGSIIEGSDEHLKLLGVTGDKIKTPEDKLKFWQTVLQKTTDALGDTLQGQEDTATLAADKIEEAKTDVRGGLIIPKTPAKKALSGETIIMTSPKGGDFHVPVERIELFKKNGFTE